MLFDEAAELQRKYILDERVAALPLTAMEAVLRSPELRLKSENYTFTLAYWWIMEKKEANEQERQRQFNCLLKCLRYARMSCGFLACIAQNEWVKNSGLLPSIMTRAIWRREATEFQDFVPASRVKARHDNSYSCTFTTYFTKADVESLRLSGRRYDDSIVAALGVLGGYPCYVIMMKIYDDDGYELTLRSEFHRSTDETLTPPYHWDDGDYDDQRRFAFSVVAGRVGRAAVQVREETLEVGASEHEREIDTFAWNELAFDQAGRLEVKLVLRINQHANC